MDHVINNYFFHSCVCFTGSDGDTSSMSPGPSVIPLKRSVLAPDLNYNKKKEDSR